MYIFLLYSTHTHKPYFVVFKMDSNLGMIKYKLRIFTLQ